MIGTHAAQPIGQKIPSRTNIGMVIGEPLDFSRYKGLHKDRYVLRAITDEIMYNLMLLSGQEYVDLYAADVKAKLAADGTFDGPVPSNGRPAPGGRTAPEVPVPSPRGREREKRRPHKGNGCSPSSHDWGTHSRFVGRVSLAKRDVGRVE